MLLQAMSLQEQENHQPALLKQHKVVEKQLQKSEARCQAMFEGTQIGIALINKEGFFIDSNTAFQHMFGYKKADLYTLTYTDILCPEDRLALIKLHKDLLTKKETSYQIDKRCVRHNGQVMYNRLNISAIHTDDDEAQINLWMIENITDHKKIEYELEKTQRQLYWSRETERSSMARELHDEIVQQLIGISYQLAGMSWQNSTTQRNEPDTELIRREILDVVTDLRKFISDLRPPGLEEFGLHAALKSYISNLNTQNAQQIKHANPEQTYLIPKIELSFSRKCETLPTEIALCLFRVVQESLTNIIRHAQAQHASIHISLCRQEVLLTIHDDGIGFQVSTSMGTLTQNNHFGLAGMAERVALEQGHFTITSQPTKGTSIKVCVPHDLKDGEDNGEHNPYFAC
jgi:PAS domain S-box-containing protein